MALVFAQYHVLPALVLAEPWCARFVGGQKEARCTCTFGMIYYVDRDKCPRRT
jgi:hypothetical protein